MKLILTALLALSFSPCFAQAPVWLTITQESYSVAVVLPAGATYRFGDYTNNKWSDSITVAAATTISPVRWPYGFSFADPDSGFVKELDILETSAPQTVTVTDSTVIPATITAMLVPALPPPPSVVTISHAIQTAPIPGSTNNTTYFILGDFPPTGLASYSWTADQMTLTVDGVVRICTYVPIYDNTKAVFTWSCTVTP